jgi:predicted ribosomally synthesized peptide with SipW-like signal peptide
MKKKNLIVTAAAVSLVGVVGIGSTLAYFTDKTAEKNNVVTFGHVKIDLNEDSHAGQDEDVVVGTKNDNGGYSYSNVLPGDTVSKDILINKDDTSVDCYVRAKIDFKVDDNANATYRTYIAELQKNVRANLGEGWTYNNVDGYYYYQPVLTADDAATKNIDESKAVSIFKDGKFSIPTSWGNAAADQKFEITVQAEAVQADHFTPAADGTWGDVTVESYKTPVM